VEGCGRLAMTQVSIGITRKRVAILGCRTWCVWTGAALLVTLAASLPLSPALLNPWSDSSAYAYVGQVIVHGGLPYRDAWDHKPPLTFYLNALAFGLFGENHWALWLLRVATVAVTAVLLRHLLLDLGVDRRLALAGGLGLVLLLCRPMWEEVNTPEQYALPFQTLCLLAGVRLLRAPAYRWAFLLGLSAGLAVLAKPTTAGAVLALIPAVWIARRSPSWLIQHWKPLAVMAASLLIAPGCMGLYFLARGALGDAYDALIVFNERYMSHPSAAIWLQTTFAQPAFTSIYLPLGFFALLGAQPLASSLARQKRGYRDEGIGLWLALTLLFDLILTNGAMRGWAHYYLTPLPEFVTLVMLGVAAWSGHPWSAKTARPIRAATWSYLALVVLAPWMMNAVLALAASHGRLIAPAKRFPATEYVLTHSAPSDTVLNWGLASDVNFGSGRRSPSRYHYGHPLILPGYADAKRVSEFVSDLRAHRPVLIVDTTLYDLAHIPPLDPSLHGEWRALGGSPPGGSSFPADLTPIYQFVSDHCTLATVLSKVMIYRCQYASGTAPPAEVIPDPDQTVLAQVQVQPIAALPDSCPAATKQ
jgi:hypothetical protein